MMKNGPTPMVSVQCFTAASKSSGTNASCMMSPKAAIFPGKPMFLSNPIVCPVCEAV